MSTAPRFAYAQARIQARVSALPVEGDWQRLSGARSLSGYLEEARTGTLRTWVEGFSAQSNCHDLERGLRAQFLDAVEQTATFVPRPWREAVLWWRWLPLLPLFAHARAGRMLPPWTRHDYRLAGLLDDQSRFDAAALRRRGIDVLVDPSAVAAHAKPERSDDLLALWVLLWRARWPSLARADRARLDALIDRLHQHVGAFTASAPDKTWNLRRALRDRLRLDLHRQLMQPTVIFLYLAMVAVDLERLRRALVDRSLFTPDGGARAAGAA